MSGAKRFAALVATMFALLGWSTWAVDTFMVPLFNKSPLVSGIASWYLVLAIIATVLAIPLWISTVRGSNSDVNS